MIFKKLEKTSDFVAWKLDSTYKGNALLDLNIISYNILT
jgi:hypothetical protein